MTIPVAKISGNFQLSGVGDGFTLSLDMVMIVPNEKLNIFWLSIKNCNRKVPLQQQHFKHVQGNFGQSKNI